jgi:hypothetical protein
MSKKFTIQAKRIKVSLALIAFLLLQPVVYSQLTVSIDQQLQCENTEILVPVLVSDFNDVNSFTLSIEINTQELEFITVVNKHANLSGGNLSAAFSNSGDDVIVITWWRNSPVVITEGKLFDLKLHFKEGPAGLYFSDDCEITSGLTVIDDVVFNNGLIEPVVIEILSQPQDQTVVEDENAQFSIEQTGAIAYQWQYSTGNGWSDLSEDAVYSGVLTSELSISNVPLDLNNYMFRCVVVINDCSLVSEEAVLLVNPLGINNRSGKTPGLNVYPNPFNDKLNYVLESPSGSIGLRMLNLLGKTVYQSLDIDYDRGSVGGILTNDLQPGLYFLQLLSDDAVLVTVKVLKQ